MLPHLACLCGNDYIDSDESQVLHGLLNIRSEGKNLLEAIGCVVRFLSRGSEFLIATLTANAANPVVVIYQRALLQYDLSPPDRPEQKDPLVRSLLAAQSKGQVFGLALHIVGYFLNQEKVFRPAISAGAFAFSPNTTNPQQAQLQALTAFARVRARLCDVVLGPGRMVEEMINSADGMIFSCRGTRRLPLEGTKVLFVQVSGRVLLVAKASGMPLLLWILGEQELTLEAVNDLGQTFGSELLFTILTLRALSRIEPLTQHEKCAILGQVRPAKQYASFLSESAATSTPSLRTDFGVSTTIQRSCHVVAMYEQCLGLCCNANIASGFPIADPLEQPSRLIDGLRLTTALEGDCHLRHCKMSLFLGKPSLVSAKLLQQVEEGKACRFEENCRWVNCPLSHPPGVWGVCRFDGECTKPVSRKERKQERGEYVCERERSMRVCCNPSLFFFLQGLYVAPLEAGGAACFIRSSVPIRRVMSTAWMS